jgi:hypothetical protein
MARYRGRRRRVVDLVELNCCWVDLDFYKIASLSGWSPEQVLQLVREKLDGNRLPAPSVVLSSGRGLLLVWLHTTIPSQALPRWNAVQRRLHDALRGLGVDRSGLNPAKVFRVPGSRNRGALVRVIFPDAAADAERWSFDDLCREVLPKNRREVAKKKKVRAKALHLAVVGAGKAKTGKTEAWGDYYSKLAKEIELLKRHR